MKSNRIIQAARRACDKIEKGMKGLGVAIIVIDTRDGPCAHSAIYGDSADEMATALTQLLQMNRARVYPIISDDGFAEGQPSKPKEYQLVKDEDEEEEE